MYIRFFIVFKTITSENFSRALFEFFNKVHAVESHRFGEAFMPLLHEDGIVTSSPDITTV